MFKLKFSMVLLTIALFSPLPTLADIDWGVAPNFSAPSTPAFSLNWPHSSFLGTGDYGIASPDLRPEPRVESLRVDSFLLPPINSNGTFNAQFLNEPSVNPDNFDDLFSNPNDWLIQAYLQTTHKKKWRITLATLHYLNITNEAKLSDLSSTANNSVFPKTMSTALLLIALIGWNLGRRCQNQNQPSLADIPSSQRQP